MLLLKQIVLIGLFLGLVYRVSAMQNNDLQIQQEERKNAFVRAAHHGDSKLMHWYLRRYMVNVNCLGADEASALMIAVEDNNLELAAAILTLDGIDVNQRNPAGWSALDFAIWYGREPIVEILLQAGADLGAELLPTSFCSGYFPTITTLMLAAWVGNPTILRMLPKTVTMLNQPNAYSGWTPLMFAVSHNKPSAVTALIDDRADVNAADCDGWTALMLAAWSGHAAIVNRLLASHARTDIRDHHFYRSAFDWACEGYRTNKKRSYRLIMRWLRPRRELLPTASMTSPEAEQSSCALM